MTKEEFEIQKMEIELESLRLKLDNEKSESKPAWTTKLFSQTNKSISLIVTIVSMLAAIWGLVIPARNYFLDQQKRLRYDLSKQMIDLVNNLRIDSGSVQQESVLLLSYYDMNSIPILLYQLENCSNVKTTMRDHIIKTISLVYMRNQKGVTNEIIYNFNNIFKQYVKEQKWNDNRKYQSLINYVNLINYITFRDRDRKCILEMISEMQKVIEKDPELKQEMDAFYNLLNDF